MATVAATGSWVDEDGVRRPAGEVHGWEQGRNETLCGLSLSRSQLVRFSHVTWADAQPGSGGHADEVPRRLPALRRRARPPPRRTPLDPPRPPPLTWLTGMNSAANRGDGPK